MVSWNTKQDNKRAKKHHCDAIVEEWNYKCLECPALEECRDSAARFASNSIDHSKDELTEEEIRDSEMEIWNLNHPEDRKKRFIKPKPKRKIIIKKIIKKCRCKK